jgi:hypothetical protein
MHLEKISWTVHTLARSLLTSASFAALCLSWPAFGQQDYVSQFSAYGGYALLASPKISLLENGFAAQFGFQPKTWYVLGVDYSISSWDTTVTPGLLTKMLQQQLGAQLAQLAAEGQLPPGYHFRVPTHSRTQTFVAGAQFVSHHFNHVTPFLRPLVFGAVHESAALHPTEPIAGAIVAQLAPSGTTTDTTWFIGAGAGSDVLLTKHFVLRNQVDVVWDHLFSGLLANGRWTVRYSFGPAFYFGRNIKQ